MSKPTQAEIDFFCHPDQAWLQKEWKKRGVQKGDWVWDAGTETGQARLVTSTDTRRLDFVLDGVAHRWTAEVDWLPTLSDLLGMIGGEDSTLIIETAELLKRLRDA